MKLPDTIKRYSPDAVCYDCDSLSTSGDMEEHSEGAYVKVEDVEKLLDDAETKIAELEKHLKEERHEHRILIKDYNALYEKHEGFH